VSDGVSGIASTLAPSRSSSSRFVQALEDKQNEDRSFYRRAIAFIINPRSSGKRGWDLYLHLRNLPLLVISVDFEQIACVVVYRFMLFMVLFSSLYEPYKAAFLPQSGDMKWWEWLVDMCFYADIILNFWTGFDRGYEVVMVRQDIIKDYIRGWFAVDFVATVEWDLLIERVIGLFSSGSEDSNPLFRLTRL